MIKLKFLSLGIGVTGVRSKLKSWHLESNLLAFQNLAFV